MAEAAEPEEGSGMTEEVAADSALLQHHGMAEEVAGEASVLLESLLAALDVREFLAPEKKALEAAIDLEMDMLSIQSDSFVYDGFEAKCNFDKVHFILSGDSDNLLVRASRRGRIKSVQDLLDLGADANECNGYGDSPLMAAAINGQVGVVRVLMEAHADPYAEHPEIKWGFTALMAAVDRCCPLHYDSPSRTIQQAQLAVVRCLLDEYHVCLKPPGLYDPSEPASDPVTPTLGSREPANLPRDANAP